jgi:hypothetical protein
MKPHDVRQSEQDSISNAEKKRGVSLGEELLLAALAVIFLLAWLSSYFENFYAKWIAPIFGWFA